jgi:hypothetical protein
MESVMISTLLDLQKRLAEIEEKLKASGAGEEVHEEAQPPLAKGEYP